MEEKETRTPPRSYYPDASLITYLSDVEGHWAYFCNFVDVSKGISFASKRNQRQARTAEDLELILEDGWHFVFGGDTCDKGPGTLRFLEALVRLKRKYPDRVHLLLGNRDINKMRWTSELAQAEIDRVEEVPGAFWVPDKSRVTALQFLRQLTAQEEGVAEESLAPGASDPRVQKRNTKAIRLKYMLKHDMGSDGEFDFRRNELAHLRDVSPETITDDEVVASYEESVASGGWMRAYLEVAQLGVRLGNSLFVHGQIIGNCFPHGQVRGADHANTAWSVRIVPGEAEPINNVNEWLDKLNAWGRSQITQWTQQPLWSTPPKEPTYEGWSGRAGAELIAYGTPATRQPTVVYCRYLTDKAMPLKYPRDLVDYLEGQGLRYVVVGHTPHGNAPTVIRSGRICTIMGDTSYSDMKSDFAFKADNRGNAACDVFFENGICGVKGMTQEEQLIDYYICSDIEDMQTPSRQSRALRDSLDPYVGQMQEEPDEHDRRFFVKAKLVRLPVDEGGAEEAYLLTSIQGFKYEYMTLEMDQVAKVLQGAQLNAAAGRHIVLRQGQFACGELYGHSFAGDGVVQLVDYLFQRIDKDGDGMVTKYELLAACTDKELRHALRTSFPGLNVGMIMLKLDQDGDELISPEEFRQHLMSHREEEEAAEQALYFEVRSIPVSTAGSQMSLEFPRGMRPFILQNTDALNASDILIDMVNLSRWATEEWHCEIHPRSLTKTEMLKNVMAALPEVMAGRALRGQISPLQRMCIHGPQRSATGVPESASYFAFLYPFDADWGKVFATEGVDPQNPDVAFLGTGAFLYFDRDFQVVSIKSLKELGAGKPSPGGELHFAPARRLSCEVAENFGRQGRLHPITMRRLLNAGAADFTWVGPAEVAEGVLGEPGNAEHGGFVYFGKF